MKCMIKNLNNRIIGSISHSIIAIVIF